MNLFPPKFPKALWKNSYNIDCVFMIMYDVGVCKMYYWLLLCYIRCDIMNVELKNDVYVNECVCVCDSVWFSSNFTL